MLVCLVDHLENQQQWARSHTGSVCTARMKLSRLWLKTIECRYTQYSTATLQKFFARINQFYDPFGRGLITARVCMCASVRMLISQKVRMRARARTSTRELNAKWIRNPQMRCCECVCACKNNRREYSINTNTRIQLFDRFSDSNLFRFNYYRQIICKQWMNEVIDSCL